MHPKITRHFKKADPKLFRVLEKIENLEEITSIAPSRYFSQLCREIIGQQLSGKVVKVFWERFKILFPKKKIDSQFLLDMSNIKLRGVGISWGKVKYLKDLASKVEHKEILLSRLRKLENEKVVEELVKVKGIGNWTAEMFLMFSLGREDVFSHGDLGLRKAIEKIYGIKNPTRSTVEKLSKKWAPYRTWACLILWSTVPN